MRESAAVTGMIRHLLAFLVRLLAVKPNHTKDNLPLRVEKDGINHPLHKGHTKNHGNPMEVNRLKEGKVHGEIKAQIKDINRGHTRAHPVVGSPRNHLALGPHLSLRIQASSTHLVGAMKLLLGPVLVSQSMDYK